MNFNLVTILIVVLTYTSVVAGKKFPTYIKKCNRNGENLQKCLHRAILDAQPHLLGGIPEFRLPRMDPLVLPEVGLQVGDGLSASFKNVQIYKADEFTIKRFDLDFDKNQIDFNIEFPLLRIKSEYVVQGNLLFIQLDGNGPADGNITNVRVVATMSGHRAQVNKKEHIQFDNLEIHSMLFGKSVFWFHNLFPNNLELTERTNVIINDNFDSIIEELRPTLERTIAKTILQFVSRIFDRFTVDELFPK